MYHINVRQEFVVKNSCKLQQNIYSTKIPCVETSNMVTKVMAESSLNLTMTESGQNQLRTEATRCRNLLLAQKKLLVEKIMRCKEIIRQFHLSEESGL